MTHVGLHHYPALEPSIVPVCNLDCDQIPDGFLRLSSGTVLARTVTTHAAPYADDAYIPREPWHVPATPVLRGLVAAGPRHTVPRCGIMKVDAALIKAVAEDLQVPEVGFDSQSLTLDPSSEAFKPIVDSVCERLGAQEPPVLHGGTWDAPGLETLTVNTSTQSFIGLHLDSWDGFNYFERRQSLTRICVNFGPACRDLLVVALPLLAIADSVSMSDAFDADELHEMMPRFFTAYPNFPVTRLTLRPGDAYIADTDNLIHDGCSIDARQPAFSITFRGRFARL